MSQLPAGWAPSNLGVLTQTKSGNSKLIKGKLSAQPTGGAPFPAFSASGQDVWTSKPEHLGDAVIVSAVGARCGKAFLASGEWSAIANTHVVWPKSGLLNVRLLWYRINDESFWVKGGSAQPFVKVGATFESTFALPPANEQKRIADKLDTVLTRVDAVNTRLARVAPLLKRFRQSVLAAATSGRLTEDWRQGRPIERQLSECRSIGFPLGWRHATFAEVCTEITVGFVGSMAREYVPSGVPFLRSMNVRAFRFDPKGIQFITPEFHAQIKKSKLRAGDLAIVRSGAPGVCCVIPDDLGEANCSDLVIARPGPQLVAAYGCIFMNSSFGASHVASKQVGVAQAHFNVGAMKTTPLPLPSIAEQTEIVRRVETLFAFADRLEARLQTAQTASNRLTPALLAKAFRGELVPQDPNDEPASELLKRLSSSAHASVTKRGRKKTSDASA